MTYLLSILLLITNIIQFIAWYLLYTKTKEKSLERVNYWLKIAHDKETEVNNLKLRVMELYRK